MRVTGHQVTTSKSAPELLDQLKSGFKRTINWNKYQSKVSTEAQNPYLDYLVDPSFQEVNRLFALLFEKSEDTTTHTRYYKNKR